MLRFAVLLDGVDPEVVPGLVAYLFTGKERRSLTIRAEDMSRALDGQALKISNCAGRRVSARADRLRGGVRAGGYIGGRSRGAHGGPIAEIRRINAERSVRGDKRKGWSMCRRMGVRERREGWGMLKRYRCHKVVEAGRIVKVEQGRSVGSGDPMPFWSVTIEGEGLTRWLEGKHRPEVGGYFVRYEDGYASYSPTANGVSSTSFSSGELRAAVSDTAFELRGNTGNGVSAPVGSIGLALALRARTVRGL